MEDTHKDPIVGHIEGEGGAKFPVRRRDDGTGYVSKPDEKKSDPVAGLQITLDGEKLVKRDPQGKEYVVEPEAKPFAGMPAGFKDKHAEGMLRLHEVIQHIKKTLPKRRLAVLRNEAVKEGIPKTTIQDLEDMGLMRTRTVQVSKNGKNVGGRCVVYFMPQGHAYIREKVLNENKQGTGAADQQQPGTDSH